MTHIVRNDVIRWRCEGCNNVADSFPEQAATALIHLQCEDETRRLVDYLPPSSSVRQNHALLIVGRSRITVAWDDERLGSGRGWLFLCFWSRVGVCFWRRLCSYVTEWFQWHWSGSHVHRVHPTLDDSTLKSNFGCLEHYFHSSGVSCRGLIASKRACTRIASRAIRPCADQLPVSAAHHPACSASWC